RRGRRVSECCTGGAGKSEYRKFCTAETQRAQSFGMMLHGGGRQSRISKYETRRKAAKAEMAKNQSRVRGRETRAQRRKPELPQRAQRPQRISEMNSLCSLCSLWLKNPFHLGFGFEARSRRRGSRATVFRAKIVTGDNAKFEHGKREKYFQK